MADIYDEMAAMASELLAPTSQDGLGQGVVTLTRIVYGAADAETPWIPGAEATATYRMDGVAASIADEFVNGTTIFATDMMLTVGPVMTKTHVDGVAVAAEVVATALQPGDVVSIDGGVVTIVKEMRLPKAGTLVAWKFVVRG
jgi:hypothetical protein